jgi:hypothetical protein
MRTFGLWDAASEAPGRLPPLAGTLPVLGRTGWSASSLAGSLGWGFLSCFCMLHSRSARPVASSQIEHRQSGRSCPAIPPIRWTDELRPFGLGGRSPSSGPSRESLDPTDVLVVCNSAHLGRAMSLIVWRGVLSARQLRSSAIGRAGDATSHRPELNTRRRHPKGRIHEEGQIPPWRASNEGPAWSHTRSDGPGR